MEYKMFCLVGIALILGLSALADAEGPAESQCFIHPRGRTNCGPPGISPAECRSRGCCFDSRTPDVIWCFKPNVPEQPPQPPQNDECF